MRRLTCAYYLPHKPCESDLAVHCHLHPSQGLGEVYESEYVKAATGFSAPDKQEGIRQQATALFKTLCVKLDALSSFTYTPKPVVTEMEVGGVSWAGVGWAAFGLWWQHAQLGNASCVACNVI